MLIDRIYYSPSLWFPQGPSAECIPPRREAKPTGPGRTYTLQHCSSPSQHCICICRTQIFSGTFDVLRMHSARSIPFAEPPHFRFAFAIGSSCANGCNHANGPCKLFRFSARAPSFSLRHECKVSSLPFIAFYVLGSAFAWVRYAFLSMHFYLKESAFAHVGCAFCSHARQEEIRKC